VPLEQVLHKIGIGLHLPRHAVASLQGQENIIRQKKHGHFSYTEKNKIHLNRF